MRDGYLGDTHIATRDNSTGTLVHHDARAFRGQERRVRPADATTGPGDDDDPAVERAHFVTLTRTAETLRRRAVCCTEEAWAGRHALS